MINSPRFSDIPPDGPSAAYAFLGGEAAPVHDGVPADIAWRLETLAVKRGWPTGTIIGAEADLMQRLGAGREALREGIRILQGRGSMDAVRGRAGGLMIAHPQGHRVTLALALYLFAAGSSARDADAAIACLHAAGVRDDDPVRTLCTAARDQLRFLEAGERSAVVDLFDRGDLRALSVVGDLLIEARDAAGHRIGTEADLAERFATSPEIIRQAVRVLADLDLIEIRRGRSGGCFAKQLQPIGVVRQSFGYFASRHADPAVLGTIVQRLNLVHLRLAAARLAGLDEPRSAALRDEALRLLDANDEPLRFMLLQELFGRIAGNRLIDTLLRCIVSYQVRVSPKLRLPPARIEVMLCLEKDIVRRLFAGDLAGAEAAKAEVHRILRSLA